MVIQGRVRYSLKRPAPGSAVGGEGKRGRKKTQQDKADGAEHEAKRMKKKSKWEDAVPLHERKVMAEGSGLGVGE